MLSSSVFKAYDVRGIVPDELDAEGAYRLGRAYVAAFEPAVIAVGHDMRLTSPELVKAVAEGAADQGADVVRLGEIGTEMLYFAVGEYGYEGGIQVTASHNPSRYNGMKIVRRGALPVSGDTGLEQIKALSAGELPEPARRGTISQRDIYTGFHDRVMRFVDADALRPLKVVLDGSHGMAGPMIGPLLERLPIEALPYHLDPDGSFPSGEPNPLLEENRRFIIEKVREHGADLGIAWDGDADRCFFIDDGGEFVPGDLITALIAQVMLDRHPGAAIVYDLRASWAVRDTVTAAGGRPLENRVGHAFIKRRMREVDAVFAGEVSGHYYFKDFSFADTGLVPALLVMEMVATTGRPLSQMIAEFRERYHISGEINSTVEDQDAKMKEIAERYSDGEVSWLDGVSVDYENWHFNVRPSNTEPLLRLNLESLVSREDMEAKRDDVLALIRA